MYAILGVISVETPQLLCELLDEIGRKDLSSLIKDYLHKRSSKLIVDLHVYTALVHYFIPANNLAATTVTDSLEFKHLKLISEEVGRDWRMLGRHLGLDEPTLESIHQANFADLKEASYQMLSR